MVSEWSGDLVSVNFGGRSIDLFPEVVPLVRELLDGLPAGTRVLGSVTGSSGVTLELSAGDDRSAGFPIRATQRLCKDLGVSWQYPDSPRMFAVTLSREAVLLRWGARELPRFRRALSRGDYGDDVRAVQEALAGQGAWSGDCDGRFTQAFMMAVREFQGARGQRITGEVGRVTWEAAMGDHLVYSAP